MRPDYLMDVTRLLPRGQTILAALAVALTVCCGLTDVLAAAPSVAVAPLLGAPYRDDGVDDPAGRHTLFADQARTFPDRGFNCSGFVVTASRGILGRPLPLDAMRRDRKGDSGPGAAAGEDWDFGYDLILNVTDGLPRRLLVPGPGQPPAPEAVDAARFRGFPLHDTAAWAAVLPQLAPGEVAYAALSKEIKGRLYYYHVGVLYRDDAGKVRFAHATPGRGSHELILSEPAGMAAFRKAFAEKTFGEKWILLVAAPLPK